MPPHAISVAGVDPSGGAGIFADLQALDSLGIEGAGVVTLLTVQDDDGVHRLEPVEADLVQEELSCLDPSRLGAVKTGALATPANVGVVRDFVRDRDVELVVDPVLVAASGGDLGTEGIEKAYLDLFAEATVVTPNLPEARTLTGRDEAPPAELADALVGRGPDWVLVTGGHADDRTDVLADGDQVHRFPGPVVEGSSHGTGCVHSSLLAGLLARGATVPEAAALAKARVTRRIAEGRPPERKGPVLRDAPAPLRRAAFAVEAIQEHLVTLDPSWFPEVGTNVAVHVDGDTATLDQRIRAGRGVAGAGPAGEGHVARLLSQARSHDPAVTCAVNLAPRDDLLAEVADRGADVVEVDRTEEPAEGTSMSWVIDRAHEAHGAVPDIVLDAGSQGKEAMARVLGRSVDGLLGLLGR